MNNTTKNHRGTRHLRVGIELRSHSVRVESLWVVDQPVIQHSQLTKPLLARVKLAGQPVLVEAFDDPRISRGIKKKDGGHSYQTEESGVIYISVPITEGHQLSDVHILVVDTSKTALESTLSTDLLTVLDNPPGSMLLFDEIHSFDLMNHHDWPVVAGQLSLPPVPGRFEIYKDRQGKYRWRLRQPSGEIVACSGQGFINRQSCEADLLWMRSNLPSTPVVPLDLR